MRRRGRIGIDDGDYHYGDTVSYLFGRDERGEYLDFFTHHRIAGDRHVRIRADGELEALPTIPIGRLMSQDPVEDVRLEQKHSENVSGIAAMLRAKGFTD